MTISSTLCSDLDAMAACARDFAAKVYAPSVITLEGPLGAGKTTFVQFLLKAWGYAGAVTSPTFALIQEYEDIQINKQQVMVAHFDCYRLKNPEELEAIGYREYLTPDTVALIEWPSRAQGLLGQANWAIKIEPATQGRLVTITSKEGECG
jgi:tRNA threonylcarbamoyladenosine biosynthesis protein TsaE